MSVIEVSHLTKQYGETQVLKGVNLTVRKGEVFGFIGHNGAGKSTFIHTITGIINKSSGRFNLLGGSDKSLNEVKGKIGVMPDVSNLYENMKGIQFLRYMGGLVEDKRSKKDYEALMKDVGLEGMGKKKIKSYSFGMKKKICIAQALLGNPELIILDEPTSGLDPESAIKIRNLIVGLQKKGKTILLTSHNLDEIDRICDRVGILSGGLIKKLGTPQQLKEKVGDGITLAVRTKPVLTKEDIQDLSARLGTDVIFDEIKGNYTVLQVTSEEDVPAISNKLIGSGFHLYEIKVEQRSLEDVFMNA